jgi:hypothetical protein
MKKGNCWVKENHTMLELWKDRPLVKKVQQGEENTWKEGRNDICDNGKDPTNLHGINPWTLFKQLVHGQLLLSTHEPTQRAFFNLPRHFFFKVVNRKDRKNDIIHPRQHNFQNMDLWQGEDKHSQGCHSCSQVWQKFVFNILTSLERNKYSPY